MYNVDNVLTMYNADKVLTMCNADDVLTMCNVDNVLTLYNADNVLTMYKMLYSSIGGPRLPVLTMYRHHEKLDGRTIRLERRNDLFGRNRTSISRRGKTR